MQQNDIDQNLIRLPKMSLIKAAEFLDISVQAVHRQLKTKNLLCPKIGTKAYLTHKIAQELFELRFDPKVISCQIVKGGVGKTTSIDNIACCASTYGAKILLVDVDPQGNLTDSFGVDAENMPVLLDLISDNIDITDSIVNVYEGIDLLPSRIENVVLDNRIMLDKLPLHTLYSDLLEPIRHLYDFIIFDCPPNLGCSVTAATLYADTILVPLNPDKYSIKGLKILKSEVKNLQKAYKKEIDYKVFLNKFSEKTILSNKAIKSITSDPDMEKRAMNNVIKFYQEIPNMTDEGCNLFSQLKNSLARDEFDKLTRELLDIKSPKEEMHKNNLKHESNRLMAEA